VGRSRWAQGSRFGHMWEPPGREVNDHVLIVIWAGSGRFRLPQGWVPLRPGVCLWLRPGYCYRASQDPDLPVRHNFMHFKLVDEADRIRGEGAPLPPEFIQPPDPEFAEAVSRRVVEMCFGFRPMGYAVVPPQSDAACLASGMLRSLLMDLDAASDRSVDSPSPLVLPQHERMVRQAILRIAEDLHETPSVAELAQLSRYSVSCFSRIFKQVTGEPPERFIVRTRLHRAERLLRETDMPVGEVAINVGYKDIYFFSRQFKKFMGVSPTLFRRQLQVGKTKR